MGTTPSTTSAFSFPRELLAPGAARVRVATFPALSAIVPLFNAKAVVLP